jgi:hypothetical protein
VIVPSCSRVGVHSLTSSFDNIASGLYRTNPVPLNPAQILSFIIALLKVDWKAGRNCSLLIWWTWSCAKAEIASPYARFNSKKQATSRGWSRCDEYGGMQRVLIFFSLQ